MKIIQSFAQFEEGSHYVGHRKEYDVIPLLFYSSLLSYITIKELYGHVTMFCNQRAYDTFVKYIPYDEIIIVENKNNFRYWSLYKVDSLRYFNEDIIHIDNDVFFFNDLLTKFEGDEFDIIVQDVLWEKPNVVSDFVPNNVDFLRENGIFTKEFDGRSISAGVIGLKKNVRDLFFNNVDIIKNAIDNNELNVTKVGNEDFATTILDEQSFYLTAVENNLRIYDILPHDLVVKHGIEETGNMVGYVHMWMKHKFLPQNIHNIKNKILFDYNQYQDSVIKYENEVMSKTELFHDYGLGLKL